ncbi:hypothetical protein ColKHC_14226 [Colletotrichum higginsianum]|nr:hypothetical protein ColKHC_14226 [Colletotrichum higginsianum]
MFALACNHADLTPPEKAKGVEVFILRSRQFFSVDLLEKNNLGVVQTLLLCGLVMQGTPFPDRCWNAIGAACRIAQGLGLHMEASREPGNATLEKEIRRRTWHGCVILDTADETASLDAIVELDAQLDDFETSVPYFLSWLSSSPSEGIAAEDQQTIAIQKNVLNARSVFRKPLRDPLSHTG